MEVPLNLNHPLCIEDPDFNILNHIRQFTLLAPGAMRELGRFIGQIMTHPLVRRYPLWEAWVVEGLEKERIALVIKVHHAGRAPSRKACGRSAIAAHRTAYALQPLHDIKQVKRIIGAT